MVTREEKERWMKKSGGSFLGAGVERGTGAAIEEMEQGAPSPVKQNGAKEKMLELLQKPVR